MKRYVKFEDYKISEISGKIFIKLLSNMNVTNKMTIECDIDEIKKYDIQDLIFSKLNKFCQTQEIEYEVYNRKYYELLRLCITSVDSKNLISNCQQHQLDKSVIFVEDDMICKCNFE